MITGGLYAFVWAYRIASDANLIAGSKRIEIRKNVIATIVLMTSYLAIFVYGVVSFQKAMEKFKAGEADPPPMSPLLFIGFIIGLALLYQLISIIIKSAQTIKESKGVDVPGSAALAILTVVYCLSLPILQRKLNKIKA